MVGMPLGERGDVGTSQSGVTFRKIPHADGTTERWRQRKLAPREMPRCDPSPTGDAQGRDCRVGAPARAVE